MALNDIPLCPTKVTDPGLSCEIDTQVYAAKRGRTRTTFVEVVEEVVHMDIGIDDTRHHQLSDIQSDAVACGFDR